MPSVCVKPFALAPLVLVVSSLLGPVSGEAAAAGDAVPAHCVAHTTFSDGADLAGDYRCAGLAIAFHTSGASAIRSVRRSPSRSVAYTIQPR